MVKETVVLQSHSYLRQPRAHFIQPTGKLCARVGVCDFRQFAAATVEERQGADRRRGERSRQRTKDNRTQQNDYPGSCRSSYSPAITHTPDGERPEKRLSYIGTTCVAGQRNVPAPVARASTEYVPVPGSIVSKYRSDIR